MFPGGEPRIVRFYDVKTGPVGCRFWRPSSIGKATPVGLPEKTYVFPSFSVRCIRAGNDAVAPRVTRDRA
jgi:hypothetical protein